MAPVVLEGAGLGLPSDAAARRLVAPVTVVVVGIALGALVLARGPLAPGSSRAGDDGASPTAATTLLPATAASSAGPTTAPSSLPTEPPTPTPSQPPQPSATPWPRTYTVRSGDTLSGIAARFGTSVAKIVALNNITNPSLIRAGQVLKIP
jgi:nucleoid-associated protein YgaU